jgi:septal ring factor EnvC (AmiA/AmiB activator)
MRKFLIPIVAAASTLAIAAPAAAQWAPPVYRYQPYDYGRGYNYHNFARSMEQRVQRIRSDIRQLQQRRIVSWQEARSLEQQAANIQRHIYRQSRNGIQPGEARRLENQIRNLEFRISREARDWNNRPNRRRY